MSPPPQQHTVTHTTPQTTAMCTTPTTPPAKPRSNLQLKQRPRQHMPPTPEFQYGIWHRYGRLRQHNNTSIAINPKHNDNTSTPSLNSRISTPPLNTLSPWSPTPILGHNNDHYHADPNATIPITPPSINSLFCYLDNKDSDRQNLALFSPLPQDQSETDEVPLIVDSNKT